LNIFNVSFFVALWLRVKMLVLTNASYIVNIIMTRKATIKIGKLRLDRLLMDRGLVESRERGQALILAGQVLVNGQKVEKAGSLVPVDAELRILGEQMPYVSRGGLKLEAALCEFEIDVAEKTALDVGAWTGGFIDCLLQHGAVRRIVMVRGTGWWREDAYTV